MRLCERRLTSAERAGYDAPFPDRRYKAGARAFPGIVPICTKNAGAEVLAQAAKWLPEHWQGSSFMAIGTKDRALGLNTMVPLRALIPNCPEPLLVDTGHYVQERGAIVAEQALAHFGMTA